jgi:hypothetical protein
MPSKVEASPQPKRSLLEKAMTKGAPEKLTKDDVLDVVFWFRCLVSLLFGLTCGILGLTGYPVIMGYVACLYTLNSFYTASYLQIDEDDFNPQELMMEGMGNSVGLFLLSWILVYSFV